MDVLDDDNRPFPIQAGYYRNQDSSIRSPVRRYKRCTIPWWLAEEAFVWYKKRFGGPQSQSLERLAERGGFGREELLMLLRRGV